jgi:flagellar assembly protein FliH
MTSPATESLVFEASLRGLVLVYHGFSQVSLPEHTEKLRQAYDEGLRVGHEEMRQALERVKDNYERLQMEYFNHIDSQIKHWHEALLHALPDLVADAVQKVLGQLPVEKEVVLAMVREAIQQIPTADEPFRVVLAACDWDWIQPALLDYQSKYPHMRLESSEELKSGDCYIKSRFGTLDATLESKVKKIKNDLQDAL